MIDGIYYHGIYLFIVTILSISCIFKYITYRNKVYSNNSISIPIILLLTIFIGLRPYHPTFADTIGYVDYYKLNYMFPFEFSYDVENIIFDNLLLWMSSIGFSWNFFFVIIAFLYFFARYISCKVFFPENTWPSFIMFLGAFLTFASAVNGIKAGVATSFFCCAIAYRKNKILAIFFLFLSYGFHHSMHVCILAYILVLYYRNTKTYYFFWLISFIIAVAHITYFQNLLGSMTDEKGASYLLTDDGWITGMRYDFVIYSFMPILLSIYLKYKRKVVFEEGYQFILNLYLLLNGLWMLCMYASFTNRIAALSWGLYPLVLAYPFLSKMSETIPNNNHFFAKVMGLHLGFTLFMNIIYY